jgi:photosystem II stability/assembly factor-like uncharacterized protein
MNSATCPSGSSSSGTNNCWGKTVQSIIIDPVNNQNLYSGLDGAGIYISTNAGTSWLPASTQPTNLRVKAVVLNPSDPTKLFAGVYGSGIFKSIDSGSTWSACANTNLANLNVVSLNMDSTGKLYAGTEAGIFASSDACATWTAMNAGLP